MSFTQQAESNPNLHFFSQGCPSKIVAVSRTLIKMAAASCISRSWSQTVPS